MVFSSRLLVYIVTAALLSHFKVLYYPFLERHVIMFLYVFI